MDGSGTGWRGFNGLPPHRHWPVLYWTVLYSRDRQRSTPMARAIGAGRSIPRVPAQPTTPSVSVTSLGSFAAASWDRLFIAIGGALHAARDPSFVALPTPACITVFLFHVMPSGRPPYRPGTRPVSYPSNVHPSIYPPPCRRAGFGSISLSTVGRGRQAATAKAHRSLVWMDL